VGTFLDNLKGKAKSKSRSSNAVAKNNTKKRSRSRRSKKPSRLHSLTFDAREKENYNQKLDDTVQRILDREREYLECQLLKEKRQNSLKDAIVTALKADL
jgi:hypothetical protein